MDARFISARDVCRYLSISQDTLKDLVRDGVIPEPIPLTPRVRRYDREAVVQALVQKALGKPATPVPTSPDDTHAEMMEAVNGLRRSPRRS